MSDVVWRCYRYSGGCRCQCCCYHDGMTAKMVAMVNVNDSDALVVVLVAVLVVEGSLVDVEIPS